MCYSVTPSDHHQHTCSVSSRAGTSLSYGDTDHAEATLHWSLECHVSRSVDQVVLEVVELSW